MQPPPLPLMQQPPLLLLPPPTPLLLPATLKTAGDPAYLSSPDGAYAAVNNTAAATTHAIGRDRRKIDVRGTLFTLNSSSGVSSFTRFDFAPIVEDSKKYLK